jgi:hypothetical protein
MELTMGDRCIFCSSNPAKENIPMSLLSRIYIVCLLTCTVLTVCSRTETCPVTEPAWVLSLEDAAILDPPAYGYYYVNEDSLIWASAYWPREEYPLRAGEEGNKMGWFRPAGAPMEVTGRRLDGQSLALEAEFPCCYPTRFQASGLYFPAEGCWEVTAKAADSELTFVVKVET